MCKHVKMAATRNTHHANVNNQSEFSEGDFEIELEDQSNMGNVPPPITITATTAEEQATPIQNPNQDQTNAEIASMIEKEFERMTAPEAANEEEREAALQGALEDMSLLTDLKTHVIMTDTSDTVSVIYGVTIVPSPFLMTKGQQAIAFFDKRRAEVPSTLWIEPNMLIKTAFRNAPTIKQIQDIKEVNPDIILVPKVNNWDKIRLPMLAPFPNQWADQLRKKPLTPIELALKLDSDVRSWDPETAAKMKPLQDWANAACVRLKPNDQRAGSVLKLP